MDPFSIAMFGVSMFEGIFGASDTRDQARLGMENIDKEMGSLRKQKEELGQYYDSRRGMLTDQYGNVVKSVVDKIDFELGEVNREADRAAGASGFAKSGTIENRKRLTSQRRREEYFSTRTSLFDRYQEDLLNQDVQKSKDLGSIDSRMNSLQYERDVLDEQSNSKFLGIF